MTKVYVPQVPSKFDVATNLWIPTINIARANKFGEVVVLMPPNGNNASPNSIYESLFTCLKDFTDDDYLVSAGDPVLLAMCAMVCAIKVVDELKFLRWDRIAQEYLVVKVNP